MTIAKCFFCGKEQEDFMGAYLIKNDGAKNYYCSSKCRKSHLRLKRDKKRVRWTEGFRIARSQRIIKEKAIELNK